MENITPQIICPSCHTPVSVNENFCPQCGKKLKEPPLSTSVGRQIFIYLISFFLAPFGLGYAFKYLKQPDPQAKKIGLVVILLTILAVGVMFWVTSAVTKFEYQSIDVPLY